MTCADFGFWILDFGFQIWNLECGIWNLEFGLSARLAARDQKNGVRMSHTPKWLSPYFFYNIDPPTRGH